MKFRPAQPSPVWASWALNAPDVGRVRHLDPKVPIAKTLPLYEPWTPGLDVAGIAGAPRTSGCTLCPAHDGVQSVCMGMRDAPKPQDQGGILVITSTPTKDEDMLGRPHSSTSASYVQKHVEKVLGESPNVHYSYALGCHVGREPPDDAVGWCRRYLFHDIAQLQPGRIVLLGKLPVEAAFGLYVDTQNVRRGWGRVLGIPTFVVMDPAIAFRNRFLRKVYEKDMEWALTTADPAAIKGTTRVLTTRVEVEAYLAALRPDLTTIIDVEHEGQLWMADFKLLCVGLCQDADSPVVVPADVLYEARETFVSFLGDPTYPKANQNMKHDRHALFRVFGVDTQGIVADPMIWARLREPEAPAGLGALAWQVGFGGYKEAAKDNSDEDAKGGKGFGKMKPDDLHAYNGRDVSCTKRVIDWMQPTMGRLQTTWDRLVGPAFNALAIVERNGMLLSEDNVRAYDTWLKAQEDRLTGRMLSYSEVPMGFNPASNKQVGELLFDKLKLKSVEKTATGARSVGKGALEAIKDQHELVGILMDMSTVRKQRSTYGLSMLDHISPVDGRVHTTFKLVRTGRLSSSGPNMQNITNPEEPGDEGEWARGCFVAPLGHKLVQLDYSQMELRCAAMLSEDREMAKAFTMGDDFHKATAALAFNVPIANVTKAQRKAAKVINFGLLYGKSEYGLAADLDVSVEEATAMIDKILGKFSRLARWRREQMANAEAKGALWSIWDPPGGNLGWAHRRSLYPLGDNGASREAERIRKHWRNVSLNTPIQCVANCFALASVAQAVWWTMDEQPEVKVVMTVHDSILLEAPDHLVQETIDRVRAIMVSWPSGVCPLKVDAEVGPDWGHMVKVP